MKRLWHAALAATALCVPQAALACGQISQNVWICGRDTPWETATWESHGDSSTVRMQNIALTFSEDFPGAELSNESASIQNELEAFAAFVNENYDDEISMPKVVHNDLVTAGKTEAYRVVQHSTSLWDGHKFLETVMVAQVGAHRVLLELAGPSDMPLEQMTQISAELLPLLRNTCADPVSCAEDYEKPPVAPLKEN